VKTPCQADPEAWLGEDIKLRAEAAAACLTCPALEWCKTETARVLPVHGVWAGRDYSSRSATATPAVCALRECDVEFQQASVGPPRKYCSEHCRYLARGPQPIRHGTEGGARTHQRRGEPSCAACNEAARLAKHERERREAS
jgi:hypothetical protein